MLPSQVIFHLVEEIKDSFQFIGRQSDPGVAHAEPGFVAMVL